MNKAFFFCALFGWAVENTISAIALFTNADPTENLNWIWLVHVSVFFVFLKAIQHVKKSNTQRYWPPKWVSAIVVLGFFCAIANFIVFAVNVSADPGIVNGQYVLKYQGKIVKTISETEYHFAMAVRIRIITSFLAAFFGLSAAMLFPFRRTTLASYSEKK